MLTAAKLSQLDTGGPLVVTIGVFDGCHIGHHRVISAAVESAERRGCGSLAITFEDPGPVHLLTTTKEKLSLIAGSGIEQALVFEPGGDWRSMSAEYFIKEFIMGRLNAVELVVGRDFRFGKDRKGGIDTLAEYRSADFKLTIIDLEEQNGRKISSSGIRKLVKEGRLTEAAELLGRNYFFTGTPVPGSRVGSRIGIPTINFEIPEKKLVPFGVFYARAAIKGGSPPAGGACFAGPVKVRGIGKKSFTAELHLFEYTAGLQKRIEKVELIKKIRDPLKFSNIDELKEKILTDLKVIEALDRI